MIGFRKLLPAVEVIGALGAAADTVAGGAVGRKRTDTTAQTTRSTIGMHKPNF